MRSLCPCDSGKLYADCCTPSIEGALPATPEQLMRSRYSAYVLHDVNYLIATWHPEAGAEAWRDDITAGFRTTRWRGLEVQECAAGQDSNSGYVWRVSTMSVSGATALFMNVPALSASMNAGIMLTAGISYPAETCRARPALNTKSVVDNNPANVSRGPSHGKTS